MELPAKVKETADAAYDAAWYDAIAAGDDDANAKADAAWQAVIAAHTLDQDVVVYGDETLDEIARELIGVAGKATYEVLGEAGGQWPTIRFYGTRHQLAAIEAKASGSKVGRPKSR